MKLLIVVLAFVAIAAADVSHLAQSDGYHYDAPVHHEEHHEEVAAVPAPAPAPEYLPPAEEHHHEEVAPVPAPAPAPIPPPAPAPEYLPPQSEEIAAEPIIEPESAHVGDNGYEYRTVKRYRYRFRY